MQRLGVGIACVMVGALLLLLCPTLAGGGVLDPATGLPAVSCQHVPLPDGDPTYNVLWDLTHGVYLDYEPVGFYSDIVALLAGEGFITSTTDEGIHNVNLSLYDVLVICTMSSWDSAYTAAEIDAVRDFIAQGGAVLVMAENPDCHNQNVSPITQAFGTSCGMSYVEPIDTYVTDLGAHQVFDGIDTIYFRGAGELSGGTPSQEIAWSDAGEALVTLVWDCGLVATGDCNFCTNDYVAEADNQQFALQLFGCLAEASGPVEPASWGVIKALCR